jgi:capsular exopolysaccharide synthesis family protein
MINDQSQFAENNQTLRDYVRVIFRQRAVIIISVFVITTMVMLGLTFLTPKYEGSVKMLISGEKQVDSPFYKDLMAMRDTEVSLTQSEIVTSEPVLRRVVDALHLYNKPFDYERGFASPLKQKFISLQTRMYRTQLEHYPSSQQFTYNYQRAMQDLRGNTKVELVKDTNIFTINVKDYDPVGAAVLANVVSRAYVIFDLEQQLAELQQKYGDKHPMVIQLQDNIKKMSALLSGRPMSNQEALGSASVKIIEQASVPFKPEGVSRKLIALAALFASIFMGIILAFLFEYMDQTIKSPRDVEGVLGVPLFGTIPTIRSIQKILINNNVKKMLVNRDIKRMPVRYNIVFQNLANQLRLMMTAQSFKTVMVTSAGIQEGTSTVVANLGVYAAYGQAKKVLIIDANFHRPTLHKIFNVPDSPGFVDVLTQQATLEQAIKHVQPTLSVLTAGKTTFNPLVFLDSPKTRETLEKLKSQFDLILIDCVNLSSTQEGCLLAPWVDKTILVISENQTRRPVALRALANFKEHNASILGAILNKRTYPIPKFVYERV